MVAAFPTIALEKGGRMASRAAAYLILVLAVARAGRAAGAEPGEGATARLAWRDLARLPARVSASAQEEVARLYAVAGVRVAWVGASEPGAPALSVFIMDVESAWLRLPKDVMGVSRPRGDAAWIAYAALLRTLGITRKQAHRADESPAVGRALGRVIAHEVVHALALPHTHAEHGLMRARLGRAALLADALEWDDTSRRALLDGLLSAAAVPPAPSAAPAALAQDTDEAVQ
jgi:hypothetical protein